MQRTTFHYRTLTHACRRWCLCIRGRFEPPKLIIPKDSIRLWYTCVRDYVHMPISESCFNLHWVHMQFRTVTYKTMNEECGNEETRKWSGNGWLLYVCTQLQQDNVTKTKTKQNCCQADVSIELTFIPVNSVDNCLSSWWYSGKSITLKHRSWSIDNAGAWWAFEIIKFGSHKRGKRATHGIWENTCSQYWMM